MFDSDKLIDAPWTLRSVFVVLALLLSALGDNASAGFEMPSASSSLSGPSSNAASQPAVNLGAQESFLPLNPTQSQNLKCVFLGISVTLIIVILSSIVRGRGSLQLQLASGGQNDFNESHRGPSANLCGQGNASGHPPQYIQQIPIGLPLGYMQPMPVAVPMQMDPQFASNYNMRGQPGFHSGLQPTEASQPATARAAETNRHPMDDSASPESKSQVDSVFAEDRKDSAEAGFPIPQDRRPRSVAEDEKSDMDSSPRREAPAGVLKTYEASQHLNAPSTSDSDGTIEETIPVAVSEPELIATSAASDTEYSGGSREIDVVRMHGDDRGQRIQKNSPEGERDQDVIRGQASALFNEVINVTLRTKRLQQGSKRSMPRC